MNYKITLSNKEDFTINEKEFEYFKKNITSSFLEFENGIINPSFVISIQKVESKKPVSNAQIAEQLKL